MYWMCALYHHLGWAWPEDHRPKNAAHIIRGHINAEACIIVCLCGGMPYIYFVIIVGLLWHKYYFYQNANLFV